MSLPGFMRSTLRMLLITAALAGPAAAGTINDADGVAIKGYDPVAYFTDGRAVAGSLAFSARYEGATFLFASAEHRDAFVADPTRFAPQYGGFCAYGAAEGQKAVIDPEAFAIVGGKLYLNYSRSVQAKWAKNIPGYITKADRNWPSVSQTTDVNQ